MKALLKIGFLAMAIFFTGTLTAQENTQTDGCLFYSYKTGRFYFSFNLFTGSTNNKYTQDLLQSFGIIQPLQNLPKSSFNFSRENKTNWFTPRANVEEMNLWAMPNKDELIRKSASYQKWLEQLHRSAIESLERTQAIQRPVLPDNLFSPPKPPPVIIQVP